MSQPTELAPAELLAAIEGAWASKNPEAGLRLASSQEHYIARRRLCAEDAETCRQAMLAAVRLNSMATAAAWRVRAVARFFAVRWTSGLAAVMMTELYRVLESVNDGYPEGRTLDVLKSSPAAHAVLDELPALADSDTSDFAFGPDPSLIHRFVAEKRALLLCIEGDHTGAVDAYRRALVAAAGESRGTIKVRAGELVAEYLRDRGLGVADSGFAERTEIISSAAADAEQHDIAGWAHENAKAIQAGSPKLSVYEML